MDTRHIADLCSYRNGVYAGDAKPSKVVNAQHALLFQAQNCVYVALTACRAGAGVGTVWLCPCEKAPENTWSTVQTCFAALCGGSSGSELLLDDSMPCSYNTFQHAQGALPHVQPHLFITALFKDKSCLQASVPVNLSRWEHTE